MLFIKHIKKTIKIVAILLVTLIIFTILFYLLFNKKSSDLLVFNKIKLSSISKKYTENGKYDIELLKSPNKNIVYGNIYDSSKNGNLFLTKGLFRYNLNNNDFNYYPIKEDDVRVIDFEIHNDILYKVVLLNTESGNFYEWKVIAQNLKNNSEILLKNGVIIDIFKYPRLFLYNDSIYLSAINNVFSEADNFKKEEFSFYVLENMQLNILFNYNGHLDKDEGILIYNMGNSKVYDNKFYYTMVDQNHVQHLESFDLNSYKKTRLKSNSKEDYIIYNYVPINGDLYIQYVNKNEQQKSKIEYKEKSLITNINTFECKINSSNILFHNIGNKWLLYDVINNKLNELSSSDINMYPKYIVIDDNKILTQDFENNFYIGILKQ